MAIVKEEWELTKKIEERDNLLISKAKELINSLKETSKKEFGKFEESQVRNLLNVAQGTESVEKVELFILYQIGRGKIPRGKFGEPLLSAIDNECKEEAKSIKNSIRGAPLVEKIWARLVTRFLGFLYWYFYYLKKSEGRS